MGEVRRIVSYSNIAVLLGLASCLDTQGFPNLTVTFIFNESARLTKSSQPSFKEGDAHTALVD